MPPSLGTFEGAAVATTTTIMNHQDGEVSPAAPAAASLKAASGSTSTSNNKAITKKSATRIKYKKAPGAPRRFKSAYMFFSTEKHRSIREELAEKGESEKVGCACVVT
jgi:hypothetical protein